MPLDARSQTTFVQSERERHELPQRAVLAELRTCISQPDEDERIEHQLDLGAVCRRSASVQPQVDPCALVPGRRNVGTAIVPAGDGLAGRTGTAE
jgi:hypothetical protein